VDFVPVRIGPIEVDNEVAAPDLPKTTIVLKPRPPKGWERGLKRFGEDLPEVAFTLVDDTVSFRCRPETRDRALETLEEHVGVANHLYAAARAERS
jgi:hypothetical protein